MFYQLQSDTADTGRTADLMPGADYYGNWQRQPEKTSTWQPIIHQPDLTASDTYMSDQGIVQLDIGYFHTQREGSETVSSSNKLVNPYGGEWKIISSSIVDQGEYSVLETTILKTNKKLLTWQWYRLGELQTHDTYLAKLFEAYMRLFYDRTDGAFITLSTPLNEDKNAARVRLATFYHQSIDSINHQLDKLRIIKHE
jgi:EpsI family protein